MIDPSYRSANAALTTIKRPLQIAMMGTRGVPAHYGGFETAVEEIGQRLASSGHTVTVYCRNPNQTAKSHRGMRLVNLPALPARGLETVSHTALSMMDATFRRPDVALIFNAANAPLLPVLRAQRVPVAINVDGVEWHREKWGPIASSYYRHSERAAVRWATVLIADAQGIQRYYAEEYHTSTVYIPYGANLLSGQPTEGPARFGLQSRQYHLVVARFEPENNLAKILAGYRAVALRHPLVIVGQPQLRDAGIRAAIESASVDQRIVFTGAVWDQDILNQLYAHALTYIHGHSVGGTNPSLLRAMGAGVPVVAFDVTFNREVLGGAGAFFATPRDLGSQLVDAEQNPNGWRRRADKARDRIARHYNWDRVANAYDDVCVRMAQGLQVTVSTYDMPVTHPPTDFRTPD